MVTNTLSIQNLRFKIGWGLLLAAAALMTLMHFGLIFVLGQPILFLGYTLFNAYALLIIAIPFRRGEKWAWVSAWLLPVGLALPAFDDPQLFFYFGVAGACGLGLLLTISDFYSRHAVETNL